jgi:hypothetical protein
MVLITDTKRAEREESREQRVCMCLVVALLTHEVIDESENSITVLW